MALQPKDPSAAVITSVGGSATGGSISSTTPVITGTADAGDVVSIYDGVRLLGTAVVAANGTWSFTPTTPLKTGNHSFAAIPADSQGNHGASSNVVTAAIGSSAPATPGTPTVTDDKGHTIPAGGTTADSTPTFSGTGTAGDTITVYDNGTAIGSTTIAGDGTWSWTPTTPLPAGDNSIVIIETNPAGTPSSGSTPIHVVVDTSVPATPPAPTFTDDSGHAIPAGGTTADATPHIAGKGTAGDTITVYDNGTAIGSTTVAADGTWSFTPTKPLPSGDNSITVTDTNAAGTSSAASTPTHVVIDTSTPATPPAPTFTDDSGHTIPAGGTTADATPHIAGKGTAGDTITVYDNGTAIGSTTVAADGTWSFTPTKPLPSGDNSITVTDTNAAGTSSAASTPTHVVIDTSVPATPAAPTLWSDTTTVIPAGSSTSQGRPTITGTGKAGDTITVYDGSTVIGTTTVQAGGNWWFQPSSNVAAGGHSINVTETNAAGTTSAHSASTSFTYASLPAAPTITSIVDSVGPVQGNIPMGGFSDDPKPVFHGTGIPGYTIYLYDNNRGCGDTVVGADGKWTITVNNYIDSGLNNMTATQFASGTSTSPASNTWTFTLLSSTIATPAAPTLKDDSGANIPAGGASTSAHPTVSGTGTAGDIITVYDGNTVLGSTTIAANGTWTFKPSSDLSSGAHNINVAESNAAGASSAHSPNITYTYSTLPGTPTITGLTCASGPLAGNVANGGLSSDTQPTLKGTGTAGDTINVYEGATLLGSTTVAANGTWSFKPTSAFSSGTHSMNVTETNASGTSAHSANYSFGVTQIMITSVYQNGVSIPNGGTFGGTGLLTINGWVDPAFAGSTGTIGEYVNGWTVGAGKLASGLVAVTGNTFSFTMGSAEIASAYAGNADTIVPAYGTFNLLLAYKSNNNPQGTVYTIPGADWNVSGYPANLHAPLQSVHRDAVATQDDVVAATDDSSTNPTDPTASSPAHHTAVGDHDAFVGKASNGNETVDLNADASTYFKASTAHIEGAKHGAIDTLHLTGDHQVLDLSALTGQTSAAKISGIEVFDLGGHANNLKVSLTDVLNLGETDLFQKDGHQQLMVKGSDGDTVDLSNAHIAGVADGQWQAEGTAVVGGVTYNVYEHTGAHTELLVQQGVQVALHN